MLPGVQHCAVAALTSPYYTCFCCVLRIPLFLWFLVCLSAKSRISEVVVIIVNQCTCGLLHPSCTYLHKFLESWILSNWVYSRHFPISLLPASPPAPPSLLAQLRSVTGANYSDGVSEPPGDDRPTARYIYVGLRLVAKYIQQQQQTVIRSANFVSATESLVMVELCAL